MRERLRKGSKMKATPFSCRFSRTGSRVLASPIPRLLLQLHCSHCCCFCCLITFVMGDETGPQLVLSADQPIDGLTRSSAHCSPLPDSMDCQWTCTLKKPCFSSRFITGKHRIKSHLSCIRERRPLSKFLGRAPSQKPRPHRLLHSHTRHCAS